MSDWPNRLRDLSDADPSVATDGLPVRYDATSDKMVGASWPGFLAPSLLEVSGHSYAVANGVTYDENGYVDKFARSVGAVRRDNRGWGASVGSWPQSSPNPGGYAWVLQQLTRPGGGAPYLPKSQLAVVNAALNDLAVQGSTHPTAMVEAHRSMFSRYLAAAVFEDTDSSWAYAGSGTWSTVNSTTVCSGAGYHSNASAGATATWTCPSDYPGGLPIAVGLVVTPGTFGTVTNLVLSLSIDGGAAQTITIDQSLSADAENAQPNGVVLRFGDPAAHPGAAVLAAGSHTFAFTVSSIAGNAFNVDYAQIEAAPADGPEILSLLPARVPSGYTAWSTAGTLPLGGFKHGYNATTDPLNDAAVQSWATSLAALSSEFEGRVLNVDCDAALGNLAANFNGVHPNATGNSIIARAMVDRVRASGAWTSQVATRPSFPSAPFFEPLGASGRVAFQNSWVNYGTPYSNTGFRRDMAGMVHLRGAVKSGTSGTAVIFTLPAGYRPASTKLFSGSGFASYAAIEVDPNGNVFNATGGGAATTVTVIDGISFMAEQ